MLQSPAPAVRLRPVVDLVFTHGVWVGVLGAVCGLLALTGWVGAFDQSVAWGACLGVAMVGWGRVAHRVLAPGEPVDLGLHGAWGLLGTCVVLLPATLGLFSPTVGYGWVALGVAGAWLPQPRGRWWRSRWWRRGHVWQVLFVGGAGACLLLAVVLGFSGYLRTYISTWDDHNGYLPLSTQLLQRGELVQPFSLRRMQAYGGQTLLLCLHLLRADVAQSHGLDMGVALVLTTALILGAWRGVRPMRRGVLPLAAALVLLMPHTRPNLASQMTGVLALLALVRTLLWLDMRAVGARAQVALLAMVAAGVVTLRVSYVLPVALLLTGWTVLRWWRAAPADRPGHLRCAVATAAAVVVLLLPGAVAMASSSGTPVFPLWRGNLTSRTAVLDPILSSQELWLFVRDTALASGLVPWKARAALLGTALARDVTPGRTVWVAVVAALLTFLVSVPQWQSGSVGHLERYMAPVWLLASVGALLLVARSPSGWRTRVALVLAVVGVGFQFNNAQANMRYAREALQKLPNRGAVRPTRPDPLYASLQQHIPPGATVLALVEQPWAFNAARNRIWLLDQPGAVAPPPGIPVGQPPEVLRDYLRGLGIQVVVLEDPEAPQWRRGYYGRESYQVGLDSTPKLRFDFNNVVEVLALFRQLPGVTTVLAQQQDVWVLDLAAGAETKAAP